MKVLIVDDSLYMRTIIKDALTNAGMDVVGMAANGDQAVDMAIELQPDAITLDNILPDMLGLDVLKILREEEIDSNIVMVSAVGQDDTIKECMDAGANHYLVKPFDAAQIVELVRQK